MGIDFHETITWIEVIREKAATEGIDSKAATSLVVQDLKFYNQFNNLQKAIQRAQQSLATLNMLIEQRQQAIASLINLQSKGISDTELMELNNLVNSWSSSSNSSVGGGGRSQESELKRNNGSNVYNANIGNNANTNTKTNGFNFRLDDKLNLRS